MEGPIVKHFIRTYRAWPYEQKTVAKTVIGICGSALLAFGKLAIGLFTDYDLVGIAVYTFALLLAKLECVLGLTNDKQTFRRRNTLAAGFLFLSSLLYIAFMSRMFFIERTVRNRGMMYVLLLAFISFCELGFAIAGLFRTKDKGHLCRNIKIINFCVALIAILTTQISILNMHSETNVVHIGNAYSGIGVGCFIALCAVYILIAPKTSVVGREHQRFTLTEPARNHLIPMREAQTELLLCRSFLYGDYLFRATVREELVEGDIVRGKSLWKRMHVLWKILCCILSEILIFVWLFGRAILFLRTIDLPARLTRTMRNNGFQPIK